MNKFTINTMFLNYFSGTGKKTGKPFYSMEVIDLDHDKKTASLSTFFLDGELEAADKYHAGDVIEVTVQYISKEEIKLLSVNKVVRLSNWFDKTKVA